MEVVTSSFGDDLDHIRQVWQWSLNQYGQMFMNKDFLKSLNNSSKLQVRLQFLTIIVLHYN